MHPRITRAVCAAAAAGAPISLGLAGAADAASTAPQAPGLPASGAAAAVGSAVSAARPAGPVTAYVVNNGNGIPGTVTPIRTATNKALRAITVGNGPIAIAITP